MPGLVGADGLRDAREEIILHHVRLGGAAGLAGDDEQGVGDVDRGLHAAHLRGIGGIQHVKFREAGPLVEGLRQHLRPEARPAHAEHHDVGEVLALHTVRKVLVIGDIGRGGAGQPAQPLAFIGPGPERVVALPEPAYLGRRAPVLGVFLDSLAEAASERQLLAVDIVAEHRCALVRDRPVKLVGGVGEQLDAVLDQIGRDRIERDAGFLKLCEDVFGIPDILLKTVARRTMIAEGVERRRRHGVDGAGTNQLLDVEHVAIVLVFCAG